jgi:hypothetical protein
MFSSLWERLWCRNLSPSRGERPRTDRHPGYRPRLEPLEDRLVPAWPGEVLFRPVPSPVIGLPPAGSKPPVGTTPIRVAVDQDSSESVIDLGTAFGATSGLQLGNGLKLSVLSNTNSGLVKPDLSEATLTLSYVRGKCGTATITVAATDGDGVSVRQTILVTVRPARTAGGTAAPPGTAGVVMPLTPGIPALTKDRMTR